MKRCPTCNQTFEEEWLSFCTQDGTSLVDTSALPTEPPPTLMGTPMPPSVSPSEQPTLNLGGFSQQSAPAPYRPPPPMQTAWQPPPPPTVAGPQLTMAVASMICGIFSITIGWCCYAGVLSAPVAIGLGFYQLSQIKKFPDKFGGKPFAITGIITGFAYFGFLVLFVIIYGAAIFMQGVGK